jgi:hypothetical protein
MHRAGLFVLEGIKYALYAVAGMMALYLVFLFGAGICLLVCEQVIPGWKLSDHVTKDQSCMVSSPPKECRGGPDGKSN